MHRVVGRTHVLPALLGLVLVLVSSSAVAQYQPTFLDSDLSGKAKHTPSGGLFATQFCACQLA